MTLKHRIIHHFNRGAATYNDFAFMQKKAASGLANKLQSSYAESILEIGCGTGLLSQYLIENFPTSQVVLTDIAPNMIAICQKQFTQPNVSFYCHDAEKNFSGKKFDLIVSSMAMHWFEDFSIGFHAILQSLKQNGKFHFNLLGHHSLHEWKALCDSLSYPIATPNFPTLEQLQENFPTVIFTRDTITINYKNVREFLLSLKKLGAVATTQFYQRLSINQMRKLFEMNATEFPITYEIIYGEFTQP